MLTDLLWCGALALILAAIVIAHRYVERRMGWRR